MNPAGVRPTEALQRVPAPAPAHQTASPDTLVEHGQATGRPSSAPRVTKPRRPPQSVVASQAWADWKASCVPLAKARLRQCTPTALIVAGADVNSPFSDGRTPLMFDGGVRWLRTGYVTASPHWLRALCERHSFTAGSITLGIAVGVALGAVFDKFRVGIALASALREHGTRTTAAAWVRLERTV